MNQLVKGILFILFINHPNHACSQTADSLQIYFDIGSSKLNDAAKHTLDSLASRYLTKKEWTIKILGYTDYLGNNIYNETLSLDRAKKVKGYLVSKGFVKEDIKLVIGKGEIARKPNYGNSGWQKDRNVTIAFTQEIPTLKNDNTEIDNVNFSHLKPGDVIALNDIYFEPNETALLIESMPELEKLFQVLENDKKLKIQIEGHICCELYRPHYNDSLLNALRQQNKDANISIDNGDRLSEERAKVIYHYLVRKGIDSTRLKFIGLGARDPAVKPEKSEEDRKRNRRVGIRVLEN